MTTVEDFLAEAPPAPEAGAPTVRSGRYHAVHPETGKPATFTRVTNWAKTLSDGYRLEQWKLRMTLLGAAMRPELCALAISAGADDRETLQRLAEQAKEAAGGSKGANLGTAMHELTDRIDRGEDVELPPVMQADIAAYKATLAAHGVTIHREYIERYVCEPTLGVCGKFDRIVGWDGVDVVGDLKTGAYLDMLEIATQLAIYARAPWLWQPGEGWVAKPVVDLERALVFHLPVGAASCTLHVVDIAAGWDAALEADQVRSWRRRRDLARPLENPLDLTDDLEASLAAVSAPADDGRNNPKFIAERVEWNRGRLQAVLERLDGAPLPVLRPSGLPAPGEAYPTWREVGLLEEWVCELEKAVTAPFPPEPPEPADPFKGFSNGGPVPRPVPVYTDPQIRTALKLRFKALPEDLQHFVTAVAKNAGCADVDHLSIRQCAELEKIVAEAEADHGARKAYVASRLQDWDDSEAEALRTLVAGTTSLEDFTADDVERLDCVLDALDALTLVVHYGEDGGVMLRPGESAANLLKGCFADAKALAERHGRPKPRSSADVLGDPVLVALVAHARPGGGGVSELDNDDSVHATGASIRKQC